MFKEIKIFIRRIFRRLKLPQHLQSGKLGEQAAKKYLISNGLKFLMSNFNSGRGEIDLIFRDEDCLVFVEVKTREAGGWTRPEKAVDYRKRRILSKAALDYMRLLKNQYIKYRFDIVEIVTVNGKIHEIRHIPDAFNTRKSG